MGLTYTTRSARGQWHRRLDASASRGQLALLRFEAEPRVLDHRAEHGVLQDVQLRQQMVELKHETELRIAQPAALAAVHARDVLAFVKDASAVRRIERAHQMQQRALA